MKNQNSEKKFTKLEINSFNPNSKMKKRFNSINAYKNNKLENLIKKIETKNKTQKIFELIDFQQMLLNHYKNYKIYFDKTEENKDNDSKKKYIKYDDIELGKGDIGKCYLFRAIDKEDMSFYACKIIEKTKISDIKKTVTQINIQKEFKDNPKVVLVKDFFEDNENIYIILELCKNKSLADYLYKRGGKLTEIEVKCFIFQLLQGLKCLHKNKVIHRDLKPSNLLLDDKYELKIGDFSKIGEFDYSNKRRYTVCGTPYYMAPEIFENNGKGYSFEVDIWSVGIIMYQLLTGKLPFNGKNNYEIKNKILAFQPEDLDISGLSKIAANLIKQILVKDPLKRPGINQIVYHYFFHDTEFPKYISSEFLRKIEKEDKEDKERNKEKDEETIKKLKIKLSHLIIDEVPKIEYENIKNYVLKESTHAFKHYVTYYHELINYNCCYYEMNNQIIGMIFNNNNEYNNMIYNIETEFFYLIKIDDENEDNDEIKKYKKEEIPDKQKKNVEIFLNYFQMLQKRIEKKEEKDKNKSIEKQIIISQSNEINSLANNSIISQNKILDKTNLIYVREIIVDKEATILFLSDSTKEAIFKDNVKILISEINEKVEIIKKNNKIIVVSIYYALQSSNHNFVKRLKYIKKTIFKYFQYQCYVNKIKFSKSINK